MWIWIWDRHSGWSLPEISDVPLSSISESIRESNHQQMTEKRPCLCVQAMQTGRREWPLFPPPTPHSLQAGTKPLPLNLAWNKMFGKIITQLYPRLKFNCRAVYGALQGLFTICMGKPVGPRFRRMVRNIQDWEISVEESRLPFVRNRSIYWKMAAKSWNWYQRWLWKNGTRISVWDIPSRKTRLPSAFRCSVAHGNFPLQRPKRFPTGFSGIFL